jgi:hypothetical protein
MLSVHVVECCVVVPKSMLALDVLSTFGVSVLVGGNLRAVKLERLLWGAICTSRRDVYDSGRIMVKVGIADLYFIFRSFGLCVCAILSVLLCGVHALKSHFLF